MLMVKSKSKTQKKKKPEKDTASIGVNAILGAQKN